MPRTPAASYDSAVTILGDLERARRLTFAADEIAAKESAAVARCRRSRRPTGTICCWRSTRSSARSIWSAPRTTASRSASAASATAWPSIGRSGPAPSPKLAAQVTMSDADIDHMICRYSRRAQFLRTGLAAARTVTTKLRRPALLVLTDDTDAAYPDLAAEHGFLVTYARILCATALCDDDLHVRSVPLWEKVIDAIDGIGRRQRVRRLPARARRHGVRPVLRRDGPAGRSRTVAAASGSPCRSAGMEIGNGENAIGAGDGGWAGGDRAQSPDAWSTRPIRRSPRAIGRTTCRGAGCTSA